ncbi:MAG: flippase-like domain-containing protein [Lachnospiraceae bacterium]|nr:flippase-like domain-containing protein [Lachnospiraceae bacterium]
MVKSVRQKQFADFYEDISTAVLSEGLSAGYIANLLLPFRLGDLIRAFIVGRKMRNGFSFAFATVVVDRILDVIVVGVIYLVLFLISPSVGFDTGRSAVFYIMLSVIAVFAIAFVTFARREVKKMIRAFTGIFNEKIELRLMFFFWSMITAFRDMAVKMNKKKLVFTTAVMWTLYIASYYLISLVLREAGSDASLMYVFSYLFSSSSIDKGTLTGGYVDLIMVVYLELSAILLLVGSLIANKKGKNLTPPEKTIMLLPQVHEADRRSFLENYFEADRTTYVRGYLEANSDIQIISDYSAGSNATTLLAIRGGRTIFRKYVVGVDADKLHDQVEWIEKYKKRLPLPEILSEEKDDGMTLYDMPAVTGAAGFFEYIHTNPLEKSVKILRSVCDDLEAGLYGDGDLSDEIENGIEDSATDIDPNKAENTKAENVRAENYKAENNKKENDKVENDIDANDRAENDSAGRKVCIERYIDEKILKNIRLIEENHRFFDILKYDELIINGRHVKGFSHIKELMTKKRLTEIFEVDTISPIHGDVTVENIITVPESERFPKGYYLIDPNTGNILNSRFIDYAKLMQSLHGGYEFLMRTDSCVVNGNEIRFMAGMTKAYRDLYSDYKKYLSERFCEEEIRSIRYHETANWLRLMPYKMEHTPQKAVIFLAGMLLSAEDLN